MVAIIDYGVGNLFSLASSLKMIGEDAVVTSDPEVIKKAERVLLPGVGAFEDAAKKLKNSGLDSVIKEIAADGKSFPVSCQFCDTIYEFAPEDIQSLIASL